jgi:hypothetical protein
MSEMDCGFDHRQVLLRMLPAYYKHVRAYDNTLITKFFGLHCVKITGGIQKKVRMLSEIGQCIEILYIITIIYNMKCRFGS